MEKVVRRIRPKFGSLVIVVLLVASPCLADTLYLKNGKVYEGKVMGKSHRRYLFAVEMDGDQIPLSFFVEEVDRVDLGKASAEAQIPFLKEIESFQAPVGQDKSKVYEVSVYNKDEKLTLQESVYDPLIRQKLMPEEFEYYQRYHEIVKRYTDQLVAIENIYLDMTNATKEEFSSAKKDMDEFYFDLNSLVVPEVFVAPHKTYLESVKATYLVFNALEQGMLEEASRQMKLAEESKERALAEFRKILTERPVRGASDAASSSQNPPLAAAKEVLAADNKTPQEALFADKKPAQAALFPSKKPAQVASFGQGSSTQSFPKS